MPIWAVVAIWAGVAVMVILFLLDDARERATRTRIQAEMDVEKSRSRRAEP